MKYYVCPVCKNVIEMVEDHGVPVFCCGKKMELLVPNTVDAATEKHVPVVTFENDVLNVVVGSVEHPSLPEHYIGFITVKAGDLIMRQSINAGIKPEAEFTLRGYTGVVEVYEYCNLHGLWKTEINI